MGSVMLCPGVILAADLLSLPWQIEADTITYEKKEETITATGTVVLQPADNKTEHPIVIHADKIKFAVGTGEVNAAGNIVINANEDEITADQAEIRIDSQTGTFHNATLFYAGNNLYLTSDTLVKTGPESYRTKNALLSTCALPQEGKKQTWSIKSADTHITRDGYAILKGTSFQVKEIPVLYSPFFILPAKTSRQSGFLFPEFSNSEREGQGILSPFFINLSPSSDITLYPGYYSRRGVTAGAEFRYVADPQSKGTFALTYLDDSIVDSAGNDYNGDGYLRTRRDRFWLRGKADHFFDNGIIARLDLDAVTDRDFLQENNSALTGFDRTNSDFLDNYQRSLQPETVYLRENTLQLSKSWDAMGFYGEFLAINDARNEFITPTPLWAMPRINYTGLVPLPSLQALDADLSWNTEYVYYWRDRGIGAHRLDLAPRLTIPLPLGPYLEATADGSIRETLYAVEQHEGLFWNGENNRHRHLFDAGVDLATTLVRDYTLSFSEAAHPLRHKVRPYIDYRFIPSKVQDDLPALDAGDRIEAANQVTYGMGNYISARARKDGRPLYDYLYLDINQSYNNKADGHRFSDIEMDLELTPHDRLQLSYETAVSTYGDGVPYYDLKADYTNQRGDSFSTDYRYKREQATHEMYADFTAKLTDTISARLGSIYSFSLEREVQSSLELIYQPSCWSLNMTMNRTKNPDDFRIMFMISLQGIGKALGWGRGNL